ncbi:MAG: zf-HC2 domain-containing protein [Propionibacteriaceae bacterium]|jgi:hypothetical protein|nr:zf-HC2 domain-containing protein [Propionibacteriaceae bacterium]
MPTHLDGDSNQVDPALQGLGDAQLLQEARSGDASARLELWRRHGAYSLAVAHGLNPDDNWEALDTRAWEVVWEQTGGHDLLGGFRPLIYQVIRVLSPPEDRPTAADPITTVFRGLSSDWREILWYSHVESMRPKQLAVLMGRSNGEMASLLHRARQGLRAEWVRVNQAMASSDDCRLVWQYSAAYSRGLLDPGERALLEDHFATCAACRPAKLDAISVAVLLPSVVAPTIAGAAGTANLLDYLRLNGPAVRVMTLPPWTQTAAPSPVRPPADAKPVGSQTAKPRSATTSGSRSAPRPHPTGEWQPVDRLEADTSTAWTGVDASYEGAAESTPTPHPNRPVRNRLTNQIESPTGQVISRPRRRRRWWLVSLVAVLAVALGVCAWLSASNWLSPGNSAVEPVDSKTPTSIAAADGDLRITRVDTGGANTLLPIVSGHAVSGASLQLAIDSYTSSIAVDDQGNWSWSAPSDQLLPDQGTIHVTDEISSQDASLLYSLRLPPAISSSQSTGHTQINLLGVASTQVELRVDGQVSSTSANLDQNGSGQVQLQLASGQHSIAVRYRQDDRFGPWGPEHVFTVA